jgi:glycosyltransferase involved in cell wall biosynthesis
MLAVKKNAPDVLAWKWEDATTDVRGAMRVALGAWRDSRWIRHRFPTAFSIAGDSRYRDWIRRQIMRKCGNDSGALANIDAAFSRDAPGYLTDHFLHDYRLRMKHPLGLVEEGRVAFAKWLLTHGMRRHGWQAEDVLWLLQSMECDEAPFTELTRAITPSRQSESSVTPGVTVYGHFTFRSGLQRSAMLTVGALESLGEAVSLRNIPILDGRDPTLRGADFLGEETRDIALLHITPDPYYQQVYERSGVRRSPSCKRIAHYAWELPQPPPDSKPLDDAQELWVYSRFVADSLGVWGLPVHVIPPPMRVPGDMRDAGAKMRQRLGLAPDEFALLFIFDVSSTLERKNPAAVIEAFRRAVRPSDKVRLILKAARTEQFAERFAPVAIAARDAGAMLITEMLSDANTHALMAACDAYISLHRAEGFGFTMAEAMLLEKPVIATGFSGNLDYMTAENSHLVRWSPGEVPTGTLTYPTGFQWAEPDVEHAAHCIRQLLDDRDGARQMGLRAKADAMRLFDPNVVATQIAARLKAVRSQSA